LQKRCYQFSACECAPSYPFHSRLTHPPPIKACSGFPFQINVVLARTHWIGCWVRLRSTWWQRKQAVVLTELPRLHFLLIHRIKTYGQLVIHTHLR
jgi:hypothetical protein